MLPPSISLALAGLLAAVPAATQDPDRATERIPDVVYAKYDGVALTMDVFTPPRPNGAGIIEIVSGGWKSSHARVGRPRWVDAGYVTFVVVHGSQPRFRVVEIIRDLHRAVRFIRANTARFGVDPRKLGVTGTSAGGHLSLMLATRGGKGDPAAPHPVDREDSSVQAAACFYPPTDYLAWSAERDDAVGVGKLAAYAAAFGPEAATEKGRAALGREVSPIYGVHAGQPPVFVVHGDEDPEVPFFQARRFHDRCRQVGARCELFVRRGGAHGGWLEMDEDRVRMREWFDLHLLGRAPARAFPGRVDSGPATQRRPNVLSAREKAEGWRLLFDGSGAAGWRGYQSRELPAGWQVVDGALTLTKSSPVGHPGPEGTGIVTLDRFGDFDLRFEWKLAEGGNSGVMFRVGEEAKKPFETGPEYQLVDAEKHPDGKTTPLKRSAALYGMYAPPRDLARRSGEWNQARIVARGGRVEHWLNGTLAVTYDIGSPDFATRIRDGKFARYPRFAVEKEGHICLQDHGHTVAFRDIKILPLPAITATPASAGR